MRHPVGLIVFAILMSSGTAHATDDWPSKPVTMVVPYAAGGPTDAVGRVIAQRLGEVLGQPVIVENVGGAGGMTGSNRIVHAAPDGSQFLFAGAGSQTYNQILYKKPLYNSVEDFTPVALLTEQPMVLIARKDLPADTLQNFSRYLRAGGAKFGSAGAGSSTHLACVMLDLALGAEATHVPYRGAGPAMQDLLGGRIDYICDIIQDAVPQIEGRNVKAIANLTHRRSAVLPDLPTAEEQGLTDFDASSWYGLFLPKGTPESIVHKLNAAAVAAADTPAVRERLRALGVEVVAPERRRPDYLAQYLKNDIARWSAPIRASGLVEN